MFFKIYQEREKKWKITVIQQTLVSNKILHIFVVIHVKIF